MLNILALSSAESSVLSIVSASNHGTCLRTISSSIPDDVSGCLLLRDVIWTPCHYRIVIVQVTTYRYDIDPITVRNRYDIDDCSVIYNVFGHNTCPLFFYDLRNDSLSMSFWVLWLSVARKLVNNGVFKHKDVPEWMFEYIFGVLWLGVRWKRRNFHVFSRAQQNMDVCVHFGCCGSGLGSNAIKSGMPSLASSIRERNHLPQHFHVIASLSKRRKGASYSTPSHSTF